MAVDKEGEEGQDGLESGTFGASSRRGARGYHTSPSSTQDIPTPHYTITTTTITTTHHPLSLDCSILFCIIPTLTCRSLAICIRSLRGCGGISIEI